MNYFFQARIKACSTCLTEQGPPLPTIAHNFLIGLLFFENEQKNKGSQNCIKFKKMKRANKGCLNLSRK